MPSKTKAVKSSARKSTSVSQTLMNQRLVIWLLVGFVAFLTLWMLYTVKAMQAGTMGTASEASEPASSNRGVKQMEPGYTCTVSDSRKGEIVTRKKNANGRIVQSRPVSCCKKPGTAQYVWKYTNGSCLTREIDVAFTPAPTGITRNLPPLTPTGIFLPTPMDR